MSDGVQNTFIVAGFAFLTTCMGIMQAWTTYWIRKLEKNTNSIKDELVRVTGQSEHAKGKLEGAKEEQTRGNGGSVA